MTRGTGEPGAGFRFTPGLSPESRCWAWLLASAPGPCRSLYGPVTRSPGKVACSWGLGGQGKGRAEGSPPSVLPPGSPEILRGPSELSRTGMWGPLVSQDWSQPQSSKLEGAQYDSCWGQRCARWGLLLPRVPEMLF